MTLGCDLARDHLAVVPRPVVKHHLGAERGGALPLRTRRIGRHDDHRRHAEKACRRRDALGVVARGERHDAAGALRQRDRRYLVVGAAKLERTRALQGLSFQKYPCAGERIEHRRGHQRRAQGNARQSLRGGIDVSGGRQSRVVQWLLHRSDGRPRWPARQGRSSDNISFVIAHAVNCSLPPLRIAAVGTLPMFSAVMTVGNAARHTHVTALVT